MPAIFFAFISYFGLGIGDIFGAISTRKIGGVQTTFWTRIIRLVLFSFYGFTQLNELQNITLGLLILNIVIGFILIIGFLAFFEGLRVGNAPLVGSIAGSFPALVVLLSIIFLKEKITSNQILAILIIFTGLTFSLLNLKEIINRRVTIDRGITFAIIAMLCWAIYITFVKIPVREIGWFWPSYIPLMLTPLILLFWKFREFQISKKLLKQSLIPTLGAAILVGVGDFTYNVAIEKGLVSIIAPIAGSYPTLFVVLAFFVFKDKITKQQIVGIIVTLIGIVLLSVFSS
ncbi:DMT family transporter [Candidatus Curtissbacteria bacterium]|nr:DMT family transporter [Candidatus Curtissbacteria bacterium]